MPSFRSSPAVDRTGSPNGLPESQPGFSTTECQREPVAVVNEELPSDVPKLTVFRRHLGALLGVFHTLQPDDRTKAVSMMREAVGRMQAVVKYQLCNDALRTVAAMAETMIQEAYGFASSHSDTSSPHTDAAVTSGLYPDCEIREFQVSPSRGHFREEITFNEASNNELSVDNADVLTNALYATLQAVNPCELSPPIQPQAYSTSAVPTTLSTSNLASSLVSALSPQSSSGHQSTLNSSFSPKATSGGYRTENGTLKCTQCEYVASHRQNLHRHVKLHESRQLPTSERYRFACDICGRRFITNWAVKEHTKCKHPAAASTSSSTAGQQSETRGASNAVQNFECEYCGKTFPLRNALKRHVDVVHFKNRDYECSQCGKAFGDRYHLKRHVQTVHMALRTHPCPRCGKFFASSYHMNRHLKSLH